MIVNFEARTQAQIFDIFKTKNLGIPWSDWWLDQWKDHLKLYESLKFKLIPLGYRTKKPDKGFLWSKREFDYDDALKHVKKGNNIGLVAGDSNLILLDYDTHDLDSKLATIQTMLMVTPRGLCFLTRPPYDEALFAKLKIRYKKKFDTPRVNIMYALAPLSITCIYDVKGKHQCDKHDYRVREWQNRENIITFKSFVKEALA